MNATITNVGTEVIFIPGPNLSLVAGESADWNNISTAVLDANDVIRQGVLDVVLTVTLAYTALDAVAFTSVAHADLPAGSDGQTLYVSDGRKTGEGVGVGTGVMAYFSNSAWRVFFDDSAVLV